MTLPDRGIHRDRRQRRSRQRMLLNRLATRCHRLREELATHGPPAVIQMLSRDARPLTCRRGGPHGSVGWEATRTPRSHS